jgi:hypothetical protein
VNGTKSPAFACVLCAFAALVAAGCGRDTGPARYAVSGTVRYDGQPVPAGEVVLEPDGSQGNTGPGSFAIIDDGQYRTEPNSGVVGGPYVVRIMGYDGIPAGDSTVGTPLFPAYETQVDFPQQSTTQDFDIPAAR